MLVCLLACLPANENVPGQLIALQAFVPPVIRDKLRTLHDDMPRMPAAVAHAVLQSELRALGHDASIFEPIDYDSSVLGSASIAQVHRARLRDGGIDVALKLQHPRMEQLMMSDLANFRALGEILQRTELKFDLIRPVRELRRQLALEFDFLHEAKAMLRIRHSLASVRGVTIPIPINGLASRALLVMSFVDGAPLTRLARLTRNRSKRAVRLLGRKIMRRLAQSYAKMVLVDGYFHADCTSKCFIFCVYLKTYRYVIFLGFMSSISDELLTFFFFFCCHACFVFIFEWVVYACTCGCFDALTGHPGNIVITNSNVDIGLLDFGQTKRLTETQRIWFARLVYAMAQRDAPAIAAGMRGLGIEVKHNRPRGSGGTASASAKSLQSTLTLEEKLAYTMFDTASVKGVSDNPFSSESALRSGSVSNLPQDLMFLLRTIQILKGLCKATYNDNFSLVAMWKNTARDQIHMVDRNR